ncbi:MAG TPA: single-stranded-DNA-specific exonuclease RecJ [Candidatus Krumholzibacteria bacterium]|nr:single-stranded-DNA-specific exonuclease RecJ [Candidatus Krumholzibacteria bacterium]
MNKYRWVVKEGGDDAAARELARSLDLPPAAARLFASRAFTDPTQVRAFLDPSRVDTHDPFLFERMREAVALIDATLRAKAPILVHGDYDVDGISGAALLFRYLNRGDSPIHRFVPDRRKDGYGIAERAIEWALEQKVGLFIAVDCGTSDAARLRRLESAGIPVIVCDHHLLPVDGDVAGVLLNPMRPGESYPFPLLCGTGVAFKLVQALEASGIRGAESTESLVDLVALATVADVAPLIGENRYFTRVGLDRMNRSPRAGVEALRNFSRLSAGAITTRHLSFAFAPRLNAPGRVSRPKPALEILCVDAKDRAFQLAGILEAENERRRELTQRVQDEATAVITDMHDRDTRGGFVLANDGWDEGVLGIAAARLAEQFGRPTILMGSSGGLLKGSGRSIPGVDLKAQLDQFREHFVRYGGHAQAVGLTMEPQHLPRFSAGFAERLHDVVQPERGLPLFIDASLSIDEVNLDLLGFLARCEPFGAGNEEPVWLIRDVQVARETSLVGDGHLKLFFHDASGARASAIAFGWDRPQSPDDLHGRAIDLAVRVRKNTYQGSVYPDLRLVDLMEAGTEHARAASAAARGQAE